MGFMNFLKNLIGKAKEEREIEKIEFNNLETWIIQRRKDISIQEKNVLELIKSQISTAIESLKENLKILRNTDIDAKKAEDKIKLIVKENLSNYVHYTNNFIEELENIKEQELEKFIKEINKIFVDFDKKSYLSYQKVTFIVGKEMANIKKGIVDLSKYLEKTFDENKSLIDSFKTILFIEAKLKHLHENNRINNEITEKIKFLEDKKENLKEHYEKTAREIDEAKKTKEYLENLKRQEKIKLHREILEKEIRGLKEMIDFKAMTNIFHTNEKEMKIINFHKENFKTAFQGSKGEEISRLLKESALHNEQILGKFDQINLCNEKIDEISNEMKKDWIENLIFKMNKLNLEIENLNNEKENEIKRNEKILMNRQEIIIPIKQELEKINVFVIE